MRTRLLTVTLAVVCLAFLAPAVPSLTAQTATLGIVQNGRYHHNRTGVEFIVPLGWRVLGTGASSDDGQMVTLRDEFSGADLAVWVIRAEDTLESSAAEGIDDVFRHTIGMKIRMRFDQGLRDYWVRPETIQEKSIGGRRALSALGEWTERGQKMAECLTWVYSDRARAFFHARTTAANLPILQDRFLQIVETAVVP